MVISHDRWFLDRIATHILAFEGDSQVRWFEGNFTDYEADRHKRARRRRRPAPPHQVQAAGAMTLRVLRSSAVIAICVVGIAGMIVGSIADNNNGVVVTFGLITAVSIIVLMAVATTARSLEARQVAAAGVDEALAEDIETKVQALVASGADEASVRDLVGKATRLHRGR